MGQIIYREYIVFRGSNISCSLACKPRASFINHSRWRPLVRSTSTETAADRLILALCNNFRYQELITYINEQVDIINDKALCWIMLLLASEKALEPTRVCMF